MWPGADARRERAAATRRGGSRPRPGRRGRPRPGCRRPPGPAGRPGRRPSRRCRGRRPGRPISSTWVSASALACDVAIATSRVRGTHGRDGLVQVVVRRARPGSLAIWAMSASGRAGGSSRTIVAGRSPATGKAAAVTAPQLCPTTWRSSPTSPAARRRRRRPAALSRNRTAGPCQCPVRPWPGRSTATTRRPLAASAGPTRHQFRGARGHAVEEQQRPAVRVAPGQRRPRDPGGLDRSGARRAAGRPGRAPTAMGRLRSVIAQRR